ncbi:MAG: LPS export ABC transporter periplasmic protein LptC [Bryobacterales bacterium]|nr:LPS export ABC transporter periplasmic protein LptC [Bryobacterales bacterium]
MLRRARWLILLAILGIAATVGFIFIARKRAIRKARPTISAPLPVNTSATASQWEFEIKSGDRAKIRVRARKFEQIKDPSAFLFEGMEMEIRSVDKPKYHLVKSERASFDQDGGQMYSDGDVEITMNLSQETGQPIGRMMKIHTSGATLDVKTSRVSTDRKATFEFNEGVGECVGAMYDPATRELFMKSEVRIDWRGKDEKKPPMHLETGALIYKEHSSQILLSPTASLRRGGFTLDSGPSIVLLKKGQIDRVEARQGHGTDVQPGRQVEYSADQLNLVFTEKAEISKIEATENAKLVSKSAAGTTTATANRFDLDFDTTDEGSVLKRALATTKARVESQAAARPGAAPQGLRILTSEVIEMTMRAGGKEMEKVVTHAPGQVDFLPGKKGDKRRQLNGERITIDYGAGNMIEKFRSVGVTTRAESDPKDAKKDPKPVITVTKSKDLEAFFDLQTGQMTRMEQWNNFEYEEGTRRATADRAVLDSTRELITLETKARMWDETGSTSADKIVMEQQSGDMVALGHVVDAHGGQEANQRRDALGVGAVAGQGGPHGGHGEEPEDPLRGQRDAVAIGEQPEGENDCDRPDDASAGGHGGRVESAAGSDERRDEEEAECVYDCEGAVAGLHGQDADGALYGRDDAGPAGPEREGGGDACVVREGAQEGRGRGDKAGPDVLRWGREDRGAEPGADARRERGARGVLSGG